MAFKQRIKVCGVTGNHSVGFKKSCVERVSTMPEVKKGMGLVMSMPGSQIKEVQLSYKARIGRKKGQVVTEICRYSKRLGRLDCASKYNERTGKRRSLVDGVGKSRRRKR